jgi:hypothetical protein
MGIYLSQHGNIDKEMSLATMLSLGNMGFPSAVCSKTLLTSAESSARVKISCEGSTEI